MQNNQQYSVNGEGMERRQFLQYGGAGLGTLAGVGYTSATATGEDGEVQATTTNTIEIASWHDLDTVRKDLGGHYVLVADLNEETAGYNTHIDEPDAGWNPIGNSENEFTGTFDGNGYEIADLEIKRPDTDDVGLFAIGSGIFENVKLTSVDVEGHYHVGGLAGKLIDGGEAKRISVDGDVVGDEFNTGGLVGWSIESKVIKSSSSCDVSGGTDVGGLIGKNTGGKILQSTASGTVFGTEKIGGLVGELHGGGEVVESSANGDANGAFHVGGLVGRCGYIPVETDETDYGNVIASFASGDVIDNSYNSDNFGGLVGSLINGEVQESLAVGSMEAEDTAGGLIGQLGIMNLGAENDAILGDSYWDTTTSEKSDAVAEIGEYGEGTIEIQGDVDGLTTEEAQGEAATENMSALDFETTWKTITNPDDYPKLRWQDIEEELCEYAEEGVVGTDGLRQAIVDWRTDAIDTETLRTVISYWRSGDEIC